MGFWGPSVKERNRSGKVEWYGKCEECKKEHYDYDKRKAIKKLEHCAMVDKTAKKKADQKKRDDLAAKARAAAEAKEEREEREKAKARKQLAQKGRELKRLSKKKKCPFCGKKPCKGTNSKCAAVIASTWESSMNVDPSRMGSYDSQLDWYERNMGD